MNDPHDLQRFVDAQAPVIDHVRAELKAGDKRSHWMWFVFPQIRGLGMSAISVRYAIASVDEARAYLAHPLLGPRLVDCTALVLAVEGRSLHRIFGSPDDRKFQSSMTLFAEAGETTDASATSDRSAEAGVFVAALDRYCGGERDPRTLSLLGRSPRS